MNKFSKSRQNDPGRDQKISCKPLDLSLYLVTDSKLSLGRKLSYIVEEAVKGGVTIVQLREKDRSDRELYDLARELKELLSGYQVPLLINDRVDIALASCADGVHLGQADLPYGIARKILGEKAIIGLSVESLSQAAEANELDADYLAVSPIYSTPTKTDTITEWGLSGLRKVREISNHRLVAIGSIKSTNAAEIVKAGADGIAVVSAICSSPDPYSSSQELIKRIEEARKGE